LEPDTYILVQYLMYFDKEYEEKNKDKSCLKTELFMEQEHAFFYFNKNTFTQQNNLGS